MSLDLLPLATLARGLPAVRGERRPNRTTLHRWATVGLKNRCGERVKLATQFVGGTRCSTLADLEAFFAAKNDVPRATIERELTVREKAAWDRQCEAAEAMLLRLGISRAFP